jgi:hypothetical protein
LLILFPRVSAYATAALFVLVSTLLAVQAVRQRRLD